VAAEAELAAATKVIEKPNDELEREVLKCSHVGGKTWQLNPKILGFANADGYFESANPA
jgi:hypothetical protein